MATQLDQVIRPAAVIDDRAARVILLELERRDVSRGDVWSGSTSVWQRFDQPWDGPMGMRGNAQQVGQIFVTYNKPNNYWVTLHRVSVTVHGASLGWTTDSLADDVLRVAGLTLATCPRDTSLGSVRPDPFHVARAEEALSRLQQPSP